VPKLEATQELAFDAALRAQLAVNLQRFTPIQLAEGDLRRAAVCVVVLPDFRQQAALLLIRRGRRASHHGGEWGLPGGGLDDGESIIAAALRELREEVGLACAPGDVLGVLDDFRTRSGFCITPVVVWCAGSEPMRSSPDEVASIHWVSLADLTHDTPLLEESREGRRVYRMPVMGHGVFAPTGAILYQFREVAISGRLTSRVTWFGEPESVRPR